MANKILITGGAGFVGANLAIFLRDKLDRNSIIVCIDNLIRSGSHLNVARLKSKNIKFIKGDICDPLTLEQLDNIDLVIDCCAEPSVLASYADPKYAINTNFMGTVNCLELAKKNKAFLVFLSSSRIYPYEPINQISYQEQATRFEWERSALGRGYSYEGITCEFPLDGARSLYGATKLCSEHIINEYFDMYALRGVINRLGVIAGPWQFGKVDQGIIGYWISQFIYNQSLSYIGFGAKGKQVRDAIHIDDVCSLILHQIQNMETVNHKTFNIGGGRKNTFSLLELTGLAEDVVGRPIPVTSIQDTRKGDIRIYISDNAAIKSCLGWEPLKSLSDIVEDTYDWMNTHRLSLESIFTQPLSPVLKPL